MIRVASYNMRKAIGTDRRRRPERIIEVLNQIGADVIALQEADRRFGSRMSALPVAMIEAHSDYKAVELDIRQGSIGWHGNALLVKRGIEVLEHHLFHLPSLEPRGAVLAEIAMDAATLRVVGMHLDLSGLWRRQQARAILGHLEERDGEPPTVLMGDLNEWSTHGGCLREFEKQHLFAPCGLSFHARRPIAALDRIMVTPDLEVLASGTHVSTAATRASDHLPIWADLRRMEERQALPEPRQRGLASRMRSAIEKRRGK